MTGIFRVILIFVVGSRLLNSSDAFQSERWLPPLNNIEKIRLLCTETMHKHIILEVQQMRDQEALARLENENRIVQRAPVRFPFQRNPMSLIVEP